ncbi:MAG: hypothetical protein A3C58_03470 [Candidatus Staskawiczbacteria bacterium RIFCSPHIGHO2_02_FULL_34_10]|uniref:DUF4129 domain-containing protein n=2 Tax=Candidatus Staskawicziibacteriota TaxID=1817916 RepID=A0A1G2HJP1_9BACT|nr:MAG: hypothetical protein A2639_01175 [Candidatus Staskawiczbacteria bacterium RIFCSPHIGHO2_01_FULL_34_27]OGZ66367.1 MAG: hypothetical protein A3C58_03470 [Candidatus Staskawiczbacteria bacterium RIFCSPHIGHO2_02_FULL_34_10]
MTWETIYNYFGAKEFIYFISSSDIQDELFLVKIVFIFFTVLLLFAVLYFYSNSSYIQYQFLQDVEEFFAWQPYGTREINKIWNKIIKKTESGSEHEYKLAVMQADEFLFRTLEERGYQGETFDKIIQNAGKKTISNLSDILVAHKIRDSIVFDNDYSLDSELAKKILSDYEKAIKDASVS